MGTAIVQPSRAPEPELLRRDGAGRPGDATELAGRSASSTSPTSIPPYNQHRYFTNYHVWETLVRLGRARALRRRLQADRLAGPRRQSGLQRQAGDAACAAGRRREREGSGPAPLLQRRGWATLDELVDWCSVHGAVQTLAFDSKRYVGAQIGIYNPSGEKVGQVCRLRNLEYVVVAGPKDEVEAITAPYVGKAGRPPVRGPCSATAEADPPARPARG